MTKLMDKVDSTLQQVLSDITPPEQEQKQTAEAVERVRKAVEGVIKKRGLSFTFAGSYIRDTWMRDKKEFDVFILFPVSTKRERLEKEGVEIGKHIVKNLRGKSRIAYAEHPYVRSRVGKYEVDIVPCYKVSSAYNIKSAVDRTPFHNEWLSRHFLKSMSSDVRLMKQFCKGIGVYGSDTKTEGFSGYLCELLIISYRSFKNFITKAANWNPGKTIVDLEGTIRDVENIHKKFPRQPLIVIDPVDPGRNVAASLSPKNYIHFVSMCRKFLKKPGLEFFYYQPYKFVGKQIESLLRVKNTLVFGVGFRSPNIIPDILWPQLRKTTNRLKDIIESQGFMVMNSDVWSNDKDRCVIVLELGVWELPSVRKLRGPSIFTEKNSQNFLKKYTPLGRVWVENEFWFAEVRRETRSAQDLVKSRLSSSEAVLKSIGIASYLAKEIAKRFDIMKERELISLARHDPDFGDFLRNFFVRNVEM
jgi:tRNA nucleotidyltransferase (CCA-adding enzyme)